MTMCPRKIIDDEMVTANDLAAMLRVHPATIRRLLDELPPAVKLGRQYRWRRSDIEQWLREQTTR